MICLPRCVIHPRWPDGRKELIAILDGYRESEQSWSELLLNLKHRGLSLTPKAAAADGALGFWAAARKVFPEMREQRCWVHKTANVLNKLTKSVQPKAKSDIHDIWQAETREEAGKAFDPDFTIQRLEKYEPKFPAACECLRKVRDVLLTFYDFPADPRSRDEAGSLENNQPDRINVRHHPPETSPHEGQRNTSHESGHDVQAGRIRLKEMEKTARLRTDHTCYPRTTIH